MTSDEDPATPTRRPFAAIATFAMVWAGCRWRRQWLRLGVWVVTLGIGVSAPAALLELDENLQRADAARQRGDWQSVASQLAQAINHPDLPAAGALRSAVHLDYARAVAVFCQYDEAEKYLLLARDIAQAAGEPGFDAELEWGAVLLLRGDFARAVGVLEPLLARMAPSGGAQAPPHRVALLQERLADALAALSRSDDAAGYRRQAQLLRAAGTTAGKTPRDTVVPYGSQCRKR